MLKLLIRIMVCLVFSGLGCSPQEEEVDRRGPASGAIDQQAGGEVKSVDAIVDDGLQRAVIIEGEELAPLAALFEVDTSLLPAGFLSDLQAIHKISAEKTILFGSNQQSWLFDESQEGGVLKLITSELILPPDSKVYVLEEQNFWLLGEGSIAFPVVSAQEGLGQIAISNVTPELMQASARSYKVLYVGPTSFMIADQGRINIVEREGNQARFINLDLPKRGDNPVSVIAAGIGDGKDHYWFMSEDALLILSRDVDEQWRWLVSGFQLPIVAAELADLRVAIFTEGATEALPRFAGRTLFHTGNRLLEKAALQLSLPAPQSEQ